MCRDTILKFDNLKKAHTQTSYNVFSKIILANSEFWENLSVEIILKSKTRKRVENSSIQKNY